MQTSPLLQGRAQPALTFPPSPFWPGCAPPRSLQNQAKPAPAQEPACGQHSVLLFEEHTCCWVQRKWAPSLLTTYMLGWYCRIGSGPRKGNCWLAEEWRGPHQLLGCCDRAARPDADYLPSSSHQSAAPGLRPPCHVSGGDSHKWTGALWHESACVRLPCCSLLGLPVVFSRSLHVCVLECVCIGSLEQRFLSPSGPD